MTYSIESESTNVLQGILEVAIERGGSDELIMTLIKNEGVTIPYGHRLFDGYIRRTNMIGEYLIDKWNKEKEWDEYDEIARENRQRLKQDLKDFFTNFFRTPKETINNSLKLLAFTFGLLIIFSMLTTVSIGIIKIIIQQLNPTQSPPQHPHQTEIKKHDYYRDLIKQKTS